MKYYNTFLKHISAKIIVYLLVFFLGITFLLSSMIRVNIKDTLFEEFVFSINNFSSIFIAFFTAVIIHLIQKSKISSKHIFLVGSFLFLTTNIFILTNSTLQPKHDSKHVILNAIDINSNKTDFLDRGQYFFYNHHQIGLATFERLFISSPKDIYVLYLIWLLMSIINIFLVWKISEQLFGEKIGKISLMMSFLFLPHFFMSFFIYGSQVGLTFVLLGLWFLSKYFEKYNSIYALCFTISLSLAVLIRNNFIIFAIASIITLIIFSDKTPFKTTAKPVLFLIISIIATNLALKFYYQNLTQKSIPKGIPHTAYIAMGITSDHVTAGFWNGYNSGVFSKNNFDYDKTNQEAVNDIKKRLLFFKNNPGVALRFFGEKFIATWIEPTFQSVWSAKYQSLESNNEIVKKVFNKSNLNSALVNFMQSFMIMFYAVSFFGILKLFNHSKTKNESLIMIIPLVAVLGTALFHLFWETKSQYTYPFIFLTLPFCAFSLDNLFNLIKTRLQHI